MSYDMENNVTQMTANRIKVLKSWNFGPIRE